MQNSIESKARLDMIQAVVESRRELFDYWTAEDLLKHREGEGPLPDYEMSELGEAQNIEEICAWCPQVAGLLRLASMIRDTQPDDYYCRREVLHGAARYGGISLEYELTLCVGWRGWHPEIRTSKAFDMAREAIRAALPPCRGCGCCEDNSGPLSRYYIKAKIPSELRWEVWERDDFTCKACGARKRLSVDHIIPESRGGETVMENLQTLCKSCNSSKGAKMPELFRSKEQ